MTEPLTFKSQHSKVNETSISEREHLVKTRRNTQILAHHWCWGIQNKVDKIGTLTCKPKLTLSDWLIRQIFFFLFFAFCCLDGKASACNVGDLGSIPGSGRSPGKGIGNPLQHSCLENPMDGGAWQAIIYGVTKSRTRLSDFTSLQVSWWSSSE